MFNKEERKESELLLTAYENVIKVILNYDIYKNMTSEINIYLSASIRW